MTLRSVNELAFGAEGNKGGGGTDIPSSHGGSFEATRPQRNYGIVVCLVC